MLTLLQILHESLNVLGGILSSNWNILGLCKSRYRGSYTMSIGTSPDLGCSQLAENKLFPPQVANRSLLVPL